MRLSARVTEYTWQLPKRAGNARTVWSERAGLILTLEDDKGHLGRGEAAPLPGYSGHDLSACRGALARLDSAFLGTLTPEAVLAGAILSALPSAPPEVHFALETALLELWARRSGRAVHHLLRDFLQEPPPLAPIELTALVSSELEHWATETRAALDAGYRGVKVKVGRPGKLREELALLTELRTLLGEAPLRLDANSMLAREAIAAFSDLDVEFLEDPLPAGVPLEAPPGVPLALDESLRNHPEGLDVAEAPGVVAWVLKLGPLGGFSRGLALTRAASTRGIEVVPSHTFEGPIGYAAAAEFALALGPRHFAAGLAPYGGLSDIAALGAARLVPHRALGLGVGLESPWPVAP